MPIQPELKITIAMEDKSIQNALYEAEQAMAKVKAYHEEAEKTGRVSDTRDYYEKKRVAKTYFYELSKMDSDYQREKSKLIQQSVKEVNKLEVKDEEDKKERIKALYEEKMSAKYSRKGVRQSLEDVGEFVAEAKRDIKARYLMPAGGGGSNQVQLNQVGQLISQFSQLFVPGMPIGSFMGKLGVIGGIAATLYAGVNYAMKAEENYRDFAKSFSKDIVMPYGGMSSAEMIPGGINMKALRETMLHGAEFGYATNTEILQSMTAARMAAPTQADQMETIAKIASRASNLGYGEMPQMASFFSRMRFMGGATDSDKLMRQMEAWRQGTGYSVEHVMPLINQIVQGIVSTTGGAANPNAVMGLVQGMAKVGPEGVGEMGMTNLQRINQGATQGMGRQFLIAEYARKGKGYTEIMDLVEQGANNPENIKTMRDIARNQTNNRSDEEMFYRMYYNLNQYSRKMIMDLPENFNPAEVSPGIWRKQMDEWKETPAGRIKANEIIAEQGQLLTGEKAFDVMMKSTEAMKVFFHILEGAATPEVYDTYKKVNTETRNMSDNFSKLNETIVNNILAEEAKIAKEISDKEKEKLRVTQYLRATRDQRNAR